MLIQKKTLEQFGDIKTPFPQEIWEMILENYDQHFMDTFSLTFDEYQSFYHTYQIGNLKRLRQTIISLEYSTNYHIDRLLKELSNTDLIYTDHSIISSIKCLIVSKIRYYRLIRENFNPTKRLELTHALVEWLQQWVYFFDEYYIEKMTGHFLDLF